MDQIHFATNKQKNKGHARFCNKQTKYCASTFLQPLFNKVYTFLVLILFLILILLFDLLDNGI